MMNAAQSSALLGTRVQSTANATGTQSAPGPSNTVPCNGYPEFCNRKYSNITMITAHNSPFDIPNNVASNQEFGVLAQLNDGVRMVQGQTHIVNGVPHLCHTSCDLLDAGPLEWWLANVTEWLNANPYEVVTILIGNGDYVPVTEFTDSLQQSGIVDMAYVPPQIPMNLTSWPTLGEMIVTNQRAVIFMDYDANQTLVPYVLDEFSQMWETPFDPTDPTFPCVVQRPPNLAHNDAENRLYMINHNLNDNITLLGTLNILVPNLTNIANTNGISGFTSAGLSAQQCLGNWSRPPNFINVDYYNRGNPYNGSIFEVAAQQNGVSYDHDRCCGKSQGLTSAAMLLAPQGAFLAGIVALAMFVISS